mmetsp:Transcript_26147/g.43609  ORF Transcript_26147/g.43609 Transcript_26147/m.43609 type:complete len:446 (+) Transcript_26147:230-1567(+)
MRAATAAATATATATARGFPVILILLLIIATVLTTTTNAAEVNDLNQEIYDYDVSWAVKSKTIEWPHVQSLYNGFIDNCRVAAGTPKKAAQICEDGENFRLNMNSHQPTSMRNYTRMGFKKIKAPLETFRLIQDFWQTNREQHNETEWHSINTYHNMWHAPPDIVNIQLAESGGGPNITQKVWESARLTLEEWTGMHLSPCSIWGIRIYHNDSILTTHVDRNPLVTSAIINVDQDVDEPWPLEVWGHDGKPYNITMEPGDMVLYESHSILHGRPFPMRGRYFANIFVHFEPLGAFHKDPNDFSSEVVYQEEALDSLEEGLPPYIIPGSPWDAQWRKQHPDGWHLLHSDLRRSVTSNDRRKVDNLFIQDPESIHALDKNGWSVLHEAARAGHVEMAQYLSARGLDATTKTGHGAAKGELPIDLALKHHGEDSAIYQFLLTLGAGEL